MKHDKSKVPVADLENLYKIFTVPESTTARLDKSTVTFREPFGFSRIILFRHLTHSRSRRTLFQSKVPEKPSFVSDGEVLLDNIVAKSVHIIT